MLNTVLQGEFGNINTQYAVGKLIDINQRQKIKKMSRVFQNLNLKVNYH